MIVIDNQPLLQRALCAATNLTPTPDLVCIGNVNADGQLLGVVGYNHIVPGGSCQMHVAGVRPNWIDREFLRVAFDYPFNRLGVSVIIGPVSSANHQAMRFDQHLGFAELTRVPDGYGPGEDIVILTMRRDQCRYLEAPDGREKQAA